MVLLVIKNPPLQEVEIIMLRERSKSELSEVEFRNPAHLEFCRIACQLKDTLKRASRLFPLFAKLWHFFLLFLKAFRFFRAWNLWSRTYLYSQKLFILKFYSLLSFRKTTTLLDKHEIRTIFYA